MDNRMKFEIDTTMQFPLVEMYLERGESAYIERGSMVYHSPGITLSTSLNSKSKGISKLVGAMARSVTSGESMFVTKVSSDSDQGKLALAPNSPGQVVALELGREQYRLNDGAFLALDGSAAYTMQRQSVGRAVFGGQGGLYVMTTEGEGTLLINAFGSIKEIDLQNDQITIDNSHVVAWSQSLNYDIRLENGFMQSIGTGEGIVNTFSGTGKIYIQSLNIESFAGVLGKFIPTKSN